MKKLLIAMLLTLIGSFGQAQQYQSQTAPLYSANAKYLNGTSSGYAPTKGAGLVLNISSGRTRCANAMVNYAGGTLTLTNSTTNYVYLDTTSSCVPAFNTSGYTGTGIAIATVVTSGGVITTITDDRTLGMATPAGTGTVTGGTCTNQVVTAISSAGVPTCTTVTSSYVNNSIALTGTDINTSNQVTATHLASALPVAQGGTGTGSTLTGVVRGGSPLTASELSGDATTSGSNAVTVSKLNGGTVPTSASLVGTNGSAQPVAATADGVSAVLKCIAASASGTAYTCTTTPTFVPATNDTILFEADVANTGSATLNVNSSAAKTIKKQGGGTNLAANDLLAGQWVNMIYDGTNWQMQGQIGNSSAGGITSINTSATGPAVTVTGTGSTTVTTSGNTVTVQGASGPASPNVNKTAAATYLSLNSDNGWRTVFTRNAAVAVTLPQINTIAVSPFVATRVNQAGLSSCTSCSPSAYAQNAGDAMFVVVNATGSTNWPGVSGPPTDSAGDTFNLVGSVLTAGTSGGLRAMAAYIATNITASGSNTLTIHMNSTSDSISVTAVEYAAVNFDRGGSAGGLDNTSQSVNLAVTYPQEIMIGTSVSSGINCPSGWTTRINSGAQTMVCEQLVANIASNTFVIPAFGGGGGGYVIAQAGLSISSVPTFTVGWRTQYLNEGNNLVTVTPTTSTIGGQTTLVIPPNACYEVMSDGISDYSVNGCGGIPNAVTNGVMGQPIEIFGVNTSANGSDQGTTTLITTGATDAFYEVKGSIACHSVTSTGTSTLTITYTDTSNTVQTLASAAAACTTLGAASVSQVNPIFRAKASTDIRYGYAHGGTQPTVDVSVAVYQLSTK